MTQTETPLVELSAREQEELGGGNIFTDAWDYGVYLYEKHIAEPARELIRQRQSGAD